MLALGVVLHRIYVLRTTMPSFSSHHHFCVLCEYSFYLFFIVVGDARGFSVACVLKPCHNARGRVFKLRGRQILPIGILFLALALTLKDAYKVICVAAIVAGYAKS